MTYQTMVCVPTKSNWMRWNSPWSITMTTAPGAWSSAPSLSQRGSRMNSPDWKRTTRCSDGACAEVAFASYCSDSACVQRADLGDTILVRSSLDPDTVVAFDREAWKGFLADVRAGGFS